MEEKDTSVGQDGKSLNIEYPEPNPAIVDLAEVKRKPGRPKKRPDEDDDDDLDEEEMTLELDESSDEDDVEEMEVAATEEDGTGMYTVGRPLDCDILSVFFDMFHRPLG